MKTLMRLFIQSNQVLAHNFSMLLFMALAFDLMQQTLLPNAPINIGNPVFLGLVAVLLLLRIAFDAGWMSMMYAAVRYEHASMAEPTPAQPTVPSLFPQFRLFKEFLPGVGQFFPTFLMGKLIEALFFLVPAFVAWTIGMQTVGIPKSLPSVAQLSQEAWQKFSESLLTLPQAEQEQLAQWGLLITASLAVSLVLQVLTLLWRQIAIMDECNVFQAYGRSIRQVFRDPGRLLSVALFVGFNSLVILFLIQTANQWLVIAAQFLLLILTIFTSLLLFEYWTQFGKKSTDTAPTVITPISPDSDPPPQTHS